MNKTLTAAKAIIASIITSSCNEVKEQPVSDADKQRKAEVEELNIIDGHPSKLPNGVLIHGYVYNPELDAIVLVCVGKLDRDESARAISSKWHGDIGQHLRKKGFKDFAVSSSTKLNGDGIIFSCLHNRWMKIDEFVKGELIK